MTKPAIRNKEETVMSVDADSKRVFPPLCHVLKAHCSSLQHWPLYQGLMQTSLTTALGTMQIMVGVFNIGLGPGRTSTSPGDLTSLGAAYWLGAVFIVAGIMTILAGQFPSASLVGFTVFMNIAGAIFAITGIVLYAIDLAGASVLWMCNRSSNNVDDDYGDNCRNVALFVQSLLMSMDTTMIALTVLQLWANVRFAVLGIKALTSEMKKMRDMSTTVVKDKGVTVVIVPSDRESAFPPLCQILKSLCYSVKCCSLDKGLMQTTVAFALGTIQIMVGLFTTGLGPGRSNQFPGDFTHLGAAYWLGGVYIVAGILSLFTGWFPSLFSVGFAVFVNILGAIFSIAGIVLYAIDLGNNDAGRMCHQTWFLYHSNDNCTYVAHIAQRLLTGMDITMIVLAVLQLCVCISFAVLGIKALLTRQKHKGDGDVEIYQPVMTKDIRASPGPA